MRRILGGVFGVFLAQIILTATTVIPPSFEQLVAEAELVFEGDVIDVRSQWRGTGPERTITTSVTFSVRKVLKGSETSTIVVEFLGGTVDDRTLVVDGLTQFANGDHDILFMSPTKRDASPIVGFSFGRFRIPQASTGGELVYRFDGAPLPSTAAIGPRLARPANVGSSMSVGEFESAIVAEVARQMKAGGQ